MCLGGARLHRVQHPFRERGQEAPLPATEEDIHVGALPHAHIRALRAELRYIFSHILKEVNIVLFEIRRILHSINGDPQLPQQHPAL